MSRFPRSEEQFSRFEAPALQQRGHVLRRALFFSFWAVLSAVLVAIAIYEIATSDSGWVVTLAIFGFVGLLTGYHAQQYLRDLSAQPVVHEGEIIRKWHQGNLIFFLFPSYYIMVAGKVYSVSRQEFGMLLEDDVVRVTCYPHSLAIERLERYDTSEKQFVPATSGSTV